MKNLLKSGCGIFLALFIGVQGIVLQHISEEANNSENLIKKSFEVSDVTIGDYTKSLPITFESETVEETSQHSSRTVDFIAPFLAKLIQFENAIKEKISLSSHVNLVFDIKDLKFPSHFFW